MSLQGDFQSMITGEEVSVAIKNKTAKTVAWNVRIKAGVNTRLF